MSDDEHFNDARLALGVHPETDLAEGNTSANSTEQLPPAWSPEWADDAIFVDPVTGQPIILP